MKNIYAFGFLFALLLLGTNLIYAQTKGQAIYSMKPTFSFNKMKDQDVNKTLERITEESKNTDYIKFNLIFNKTEFLNNF